MTDVELREVTVRVEAAVTLLTRGLLGVAPLVDCAESAVLWLGQASELLERAA
jgi:hypothetical protein